MTSGGKTWITLSTSPAYHPGLTIKNARAFAPDEVGLRKCYMNHAMKRVVAVTGACTYLGGELLRRLEEDPRYSRILALDVRPPAQANSGPMSSSAGLPGARS